MSAVRDAVGAQLEGIERDEGPRIEVLSQFIQAELDRLSGSLPQDDGRVVSIEELDELLPATVKEAWLVDEARS